MLQKNLTGQASPVEGNLNEFAMILTSDGLLDYS